MASKGNIQIVIDIEGKEAVNEFQKLYDSSQKFGRQIKELNDENKKYRSEMNLLKAELKNLTKGTEEYANTKAKIDALNASIKANNLVNADLVKKQKEVTEQMDKAREKLQLQDLTYRQLQREVSKLSKELNGLIPGTDAFIKKGEELAKVSTQYNKVKNEIEGFSRELTKTNPIIDFLKKGFQQLGAIIVATFALDAIRNFFQSAIQNFAKVSDQFADIQKTTGKTTEQVKDFSKELEKIDTRTSFEGLLDITKVAGQIGIANDQLKDFVQTADKASVALKDEFSGGVEEVTKSLGGIQKLFKETKDLGAGDALNKIGSAINDLGSVGTATGPVIADFTSRMGALPGTIAPSVTETLGLGAAFQELGLSSEIASGGLTNVFLKAGENSAKFAKQMGISKAEFEKAFNQDSNATILRLAESLKGLSDTDLIKTLDNLGIGTQESIKVLGALANNTDLVRQRQELANKSFKEGTSLTNEFNIKNNTFNAQLEKSVKETSKFAREFGEFLAPALSKSLELFSAFLNGLRNAPKFIQENLISITLLTTAYLVYNQQIIQARINLIAQNIATRAGALANTLASTATAIYSTVVGVLTGKISLATIAQRAFNLAMRLNPIGLIITLVGGLIAGLIALYNNFEGVRSVVNGVGSSFKAFFGYVFDQIKALLSLDFSKLISNFTNLGVRLKDAYKQGSAAESIQRDAEANRKAYEKSAKAFNDTVEKQKKASEKLQKLLDEKAGKNKPSSPVLDDKEIKAQEAQQNKLKEAQEKYDKAALDARRKLEDLKLELIGDSFARERAKIKTEESRKIEDVQKQIKELEGLQKLGVKIDPEAIPNLKKQIDLVQKEAQKKLDQVDLKQKITVIETQVQEAKQVLISETSGASDEQKLAARKKFNARIQALDLEKIENELKTLDSANTEELLKIEQLETQKAELKQKFKEEDLQLELTAIEEKYALLQEAEEIKFLKQNNSVEELRKAALEENFVATLDAEMVHQEALYNLKQEAIDKELQLLDSKGQSETNAYKKLQKERLKNEQDFSKKTLDNEKKTAELKAKVFQENFKLASDFIQLGIELLGQDEKARKKNADLIKAFSIGKIVADLAVEIAGYNATPQSTFSLGAVGIIKSVAASIRAGIAIANVSKQQFSAGGLLKAGKKILNMSQANDGSWYYAQGGLVRNAGVLSGSSHAQGGLSVFDNRSGKQVAEFEGGEPAMILSKSTYGNNKSLIDSLLYSSLYLNGAPVRYETGGIVSTSPLAPEGGTNSPVNIDFSVLVSEIRDLKNIVANQQTMLRAYVLLQDVQDNQTKYEDIQSRNRLR